MEVLKPSLSWIGGRCYRNISDVQGDLNQPMCQIEQETCSNYSSYVEDEEHINPELKFEQLDDDTYKTSITIPNPLLKFIIGAKGVTKKRIEAETNTRIVVPRKAEGDNVIISGQDKKGIAACYTRLSMIMDSARQKQPFTHFISIPLNDDVIKCNLRQFKDEVLSECCPQGRGIQCNLFQNPDKLHLTIGTLILLNDTDRNNASHVLTKCRDEVILPMLEGNPLKLGVQGLEYMNDDPSEVDVLYAKVSDDDNRLQNIADKIIETFAATGLLAKQYDRVKIHATIMNTLFGSERKESVETGKARGEFRRETFDARPIFEKFKSYSFGEITWDEIHLSQRHSAAQDGYYKPTLKLHLS